jgi:hypothetical protein
MTSIEWLEKEIWKRGPIGEDTPNWLKELYEQAKEMHKQEIIDAYERRLGNNYNFELSGEEYYQETFDSNRTDAKDTEKEMFELEQQLDIPSHMRWHNKELPQQELSDDEIEQQALTFAKEESYGELSADLWKGYVYGAKRTRDHSKSLSDKWKEYQDWLNEPPELSDEEIEKGAKEWYNKEGAYSASAIALKTWVYAIRWYREQLKQK